MMNLTLKRQEYKHQIQESVQKVMQNLSKLEEVLRISLFGSFARGRVDIFTDLDILVVMKTEKGILERLNMLYPILDVTVDVDLLCYTLEEFESLRGRGFLRKVLAEEVVLYEKKFT